MLRSKAITDTEKVVLLTSTKAVQALEAREVLLLLAVVFWPATGRMETFNVGNLQ